MKSSSILNIIKYNIIIQWQRAYPYLYSVSSTSMSSRIYYRYYYSYTKHQIQIFHFQINLFRFHCQHDVLYNILCTFCNRIIFYIVIRVWPLRVSRPALLLSISWFRLRSVAKVEDK